MKLTGFAKAAIIALLVPIVPFIVIGELPGDRWLSSADDSAVLFGITGAALLAADLLIPVPSSLMGSLLGARLGMLEGFLWAWIGLMAGNVTGYLLGRFALSRFASLEKSARDLELWVLFVSRPVPVLAEAVTITAGASQISLPQFVIFAGCGNAVYALAMTAAGAALLPQALIGPGLALPMLVPVIGWLIWRMFSFRSERPKE